MPPPLPFAPANDLLRGAAKDDEYITLLTSALNEFLLSIVPNSAASSSRANAIASTSARLLYFLTPLLRPIPTTPGEEYAAILPVRVTDHFTRLPTRGALLLRALAQLPSSETIVKGLRLVWKEISYRTFPHEAASGLVDAAQRLHTACFYLRGAFQTPASRLARLRHVRVALRPGIGVPDFWLRVLGVVAILQVLADLARALRRAIARARGLENQHRNPWTAPSKQFLRRVLWFWIYPHESAVDDAEEDSNATSKCILCLGSVKNATLTRCGHVFCWQCICAWCAENVCNMFRLTIFAQHCYSSTNCISFVLLRSSPLLWTQEICPLCRQELTLKKLVCLYNY